MFKENNNCVNHKDSKFLFYCFDDKSYLCEKCFREHKSHNVEIREDIKKVSDYIKYLRKTDSKIIKKSYEDIEKNLKDLKDKIEQILLEIKKLTVTMKDFEKNKTPDDFENIKHEEFESLLNCINIRSKAFNIVNSSLPFLNKITKNLIIHSNLKYINKEVSIVSNSQIYDNFSVDILLGKSNSYPYTLFDLSQNKNHFLIVDLNQNYYLNSIRIQVTTNDCCLKNFTVNIKETNDENENWVKVGDFIRKREDQNDQYQSFEIGHYCRQIKFLFIDPWGTKDGNYILIKRIDFEVGE